ncbi:MAG: NUDIX hydrolase [Luminiphilus sp.]|nr:NUDIX hydrolase [Luminiphilus sp.]
MFEKADLQRESTPARPAATLIVTREGEAGLETLLLRRNPSLKVMAGAWVFPGGKVDGEDEGADALSRARAAAVRELAEETGLAVGDLPLLHFSRWLTPEVVQHRFDTYFFLSPQSPDAEVRVDGSEIVEHRWVRPAQAVAEQAAGSLKIPPPTLVSLTDLVEHDSIAGLVAAVEKRTPPYFFPRITEMGEDHVFLYPGDSGYEASDPAADGCQHRTTMCKGLFSYRRDFNWPDRP